MILLAIDKSTEAGKRSWSYINGILSGWKRDACARRGMWKPTNKADKPDREASSQPRP
jgi:hypothetical protein